MRTLVYRILFVFLVFLPDVGLAKSNKVALVIGNSEYSFVPNLANPANDASDIGAALTRLGFDVTSGLNLEYNAMRLAVRDFAEKAAEAEIMVIYFAGHGIEIGNTNYLIPVNARLRSDRDIEFEAIQLDTIVRAVSGSSGLKIVLVDACRNNPFVKNMQRTSATRSVGRGLARIDPGGTLVGYSARGGTLALDGDDRNSPYADALLNHLEQPGLEIGKMFRMVRDQVFSSTDGYQEPFTYGSLPGRDIYLKPPSSVAALRPSADILTTEPDYQSNMIAAFSKADRSASLKLWESFLAKYSVYPDHYLVAMANAKYSKLRDAEEKKKRSQNREPWLKDAVEQDGRTVQLNQEHRKLIQKSLSYMGYDVGALDGQFGPRTRNAISRARIELALYPSSQIDVALLRLLPDVHAIDALISDKARSLAGVEIPETLGTRLTRAINAIGRRTFKFGFFEGHLYFVVKNAGYESWSADNQVAKEAGGYLATITSNRENNFVFNLFYSDPQFYYVQRSSVVGPMFGLFQADKSREPASGWVWANGETLEYSNWAQGQPDDSNGGSFGRFYKSLRQGNSNKRPIKWDDGPSTARSYIIEID